MCQSAIQWIVFCEMFRIFTQANRNLPYRLHSKFTRLRAVTDFEQKMSQLLRNQLKFARNQLSCVT